MAYTVFAAGGLNFAVFSDTNPPSGPIFTSTPVETGNSGEFYTYTAAATDPNDQELTYSLVSPPDGMTINQWTGRIMWVPSDTDIGANSITVRVTDEDSLTADQTFTLTIGAFTGIDIDQDWLDARSAPYILSTANETYRLLVDVTTDGTAFICGAANVVFNLNGHTITYGNRSPIEVTNGGFETDAVGATTVTGWDLTGAPNAAVAANDYRMWGDKVLKFSGLNLTEYIESDPISIPTPNIEYGVNCIAKDWNKYASSGCTMAIIDDDTDEIIRQTSDGYPYTSGTWDVSRGRSQILYFTPDESVSAIRIRITITPTTSQGPIAVDYVEMRHGRDYGIIAAGWDSWYVGGPLMNMSGVRSAVRANRNSTIINGTVTQGQAKGFQSHSIAASAARVDTVQGGGLTIYDVDINISGTGTQEIHAYQPFAGAVLYISNCTLTNTADKQNDRMGSIYAIATTRLEYGNAQALIYNNTLNGTAQNGITATGGTARHEVAGNTIYPDIVCTNGYAIGVGGKCHCHHNTVTVAEGANGRGLYVESGPTDGLCHIHDNTFSCREGYNYEYRVSGYSCTTVRLRDLTSSGLIQNILIEHNTFEVYTDETLTKDAYAYRGAHIDVDGEGSLNFIVRNNMFKAIADTSNTDWWAYALGVDLVHSPGHPEFTDNIFESNVCALALGSSDGYGNPVVASTFTSNSIVKSADGEARTFVYAVAGNNNDDITATMCDSTFSGGATDEYTYAGAGTKAISRAWLLTVEVEDGSGNPISGATVTVFDKESEEVGSGTTDANGLVSELVIVEEIETKVGAAAVSTNNRNDHTIQVTKDGYTPYSHTETVDATKTHTAVMTAV